MAFISENMLFIVSSLLVAGLIAGAGFLQSLQQQGTPPQASTGATVSQQRAHSAAAPATGTANVTTTALQTAPTAAPAQTAVKPSIRGGGEGGEREGGYDN